jgi:hypothetical protein
MIQIVFNEISAAEMAVLPTLLQLELLAEFEILPDDLKLLQSGTHERFGVIDRDGRKLYRFRSADHRIYFEPSGEGIVVHRVLHKNTIRDFLFRTALPMGEDDQLKQAPAFWELIDEGVQARRSS